MTQYLLSVHSVEGEVRDPMSSESVRQVGILEQEMKSAGAWVFSGRLHEPDSATVVRVSDGAVLTTDGPFVESKEHLGGFYIIEAEDLDAALGWATFGSANNLCTASRTPNGAGSLARPPRSSTERPVRRARRHCQPPCRGHRPKHQLAGSWAHPRRCRLGTAAPKGRSQGFADADRRGARTASSVGQGAVEDIHHVTITHPGIG
jgi:hypothetical protein